ncbi:unnamed protein product [Camellia sinensis]
MEVQEESEEKTALQSCLPDDIALKIASSLQMCSRWVVARGFGARRVGRIVCGRVCTETDGQPLIWAETLLHLHRSKPISLTHKFSPPPCWASSDLCVVDFDIPFSFAFVVAPLIESVAIIGIMASVTWQVLFVAFFATVASKYVQGYYQASARELMRINGTTKAPVMNYAAETSLGVVTIRAFNMANRFFQNYLKLVDNDAKLFFYSNATMEWLILRVEALQNLTLFTVVFLLVLLPKGYVDPGLVGLSLSYALALTSTQVFMIRWYSSLANYIISVERIKQFMHIPPEPPAIVEDRRPPSSWPSKGRIGLQDLRALEKCQLKTTINSLPMSDEGENWSVGQRQLFCLGRVLLRRNKFLVLDEATASIDSTTDAILQRIIREEFSNCTVLTVAHRVPTVIDSDMVMHLSSKKRVSVVAISNDGLFVCFADKFGVVWVVDLDGLHENQASPSKKKAVTILAHYCSIITSLEYSPDGRFIVRAGRDFKIRVTVFPKKPLDGAHEIQSFCLGHTE